MKIHDAQDPSVVQFKTRIKSKCLIFTKSKGQKYLFFFWHTIFFFAQLGPTGKERVNIPMDICVIGIVRVKRKKEQNS